MHLGVTREDFFVGDQSWIGSRDFTPPRNVTLDLSAFTKATHYPNGFLLSGIAIAPITATGLYGPYDSAATDGRENDTDGGFLFSEIPVSMVDNTADPSGALFYRGVVRSSRLPLSVDAATFGDRIIFVP